MKVVMVLVIMLAVCHLAANFGGEADGGGGRERQRTRRSEIFDKQGKRQIDKNMHRQSDERTETR